MSDAESKFKKSKRRANTYSASKKQSEIAKLAGFTPDSPHRYAKRHALNCGNPNCIHCGNPRKFFNDPTMQEKRFNEAHKNDDTN